jgi:hypothetical protein
MVSRSFPNLEENIDSLARSQQGTKEDIRVVGVLKAVEDSDDLLHRSILAPGGSRNQKEIRVKTVTAA